MSDNIFAGVAVGPTRRRVAQGVAWSAPIITLGSAAPAYSTSPAACLPATCLAAADTAFGTSATSTNGWRLSTTGAFYGGADQSIGWYNNFTYYKDKTMVHSSSSPQSGLCDQANHFTTSTTVSLSGPTVVAQGDPSAPGSSVTWSKSFCLQGGKTYTFSYNWISYGPNGLRATQRTFIVAGSTPQGLAGTQIGSTEVSAARSDNRSGNSTAVYLAPTTGTYTFYYYWDFGSPAGGYPQRAYTDCDTYANDFAVNAPTVTCV